MMSQTTQIRRPRTTRIARIVLAIAALALGVAAAITGAPSRTGEAGSTKPAVVRPGNGC
jgi:hypothetical protein